jgi:class 3 adenylate cyclase
MIPSPRLIPFLVSPLTQDPEAVFRSISKLLSHSVQETGENYPGHGLAQRNTSVLRQQLRAQLKYTSMHKLRRLRAPTLVLHGAEDRLIPPANAKLVARLLPGAKLELVPGAGHLLYRDRPRETDRAVFDFLLDAAVGILDTQELGFLPAPGRPEQRREQATVLFTDIVDSTVHVVRLGDDEWARLLAHHDKLTHDLVMDYGGRLVTSTGDGVLAVFQEPIQGIRCAPHIIEQVRTIGLEVRSGLHSGECTVSGNRISRLTVHVAARVAACAGAGEVRVSEALRDLVPLEDASVRYCGVHVLKGLPGEWPLFAV